MSTLGNPWRSMAPALILVAAFDSQGVGGTGGAAHGLVSIARTNTPSHLLVKFHPRTSPEQVAAAHQKLGAVVIQRFDSIGWQQVRLPQPVTVEIALDHYRKSTGVQDVELEYEYELASIPNDPHFPQQWALTRVGAEAAWDISTGSHEVVVAVIDSGINYEHEDVRDNIWLNPAEIAGNGVDDDANGYVDDVHGIDTGDGDNDPMDFIGHGTRVAGIIGARGNNGQGGAGMNWSVQIIALKVIIQSTGAATTASLLEAYEYILTLKRGGVNIRVTNNSVGGPSFSQAYLDMLNACGEAGILNVCVAGNTTTDIDAFPIYPGCYDSDFILNTASSDSMDQLAETSNYGATNVDLAAPGLNLLTLDLTGYVSTFSGTSAAAAMVTGAIALMSAADPGQSALSLRHTLLRSVDPVPGLTNKVASGGRLNVATAIHSIGPSPALVVNRTIDGTFELRWPAWAVDFTLRHAARPDAAAEWQSVEGTPTMQSGLYTLTISTAATEQFFRLQREPLLNPRPPLPAP